MNSPYRLHYFGEPWDSPMLDAPTEQIPLPIEPCIQCYEAFEDGDQGYLYPNGAPVHRECALRAILGGINHLKGTCSCQGGPDAPDPPGVSRRKAAQLAWDWVQEHSNG